jgi:hypothetical protein
MDIIKQALDSALPDSFDPTNYFTSLLISIIGILVAVGIFRLCFGKGSMLNCAVSSAIAIVSLYVINVVLYSFGSGLKILFTPLPFVTISEGYLQIFPIFNASFREICAEVFNLLILSYLMNLLQTWLPKGNKIWSWFGFRFLSLLLAICLHYCVHILLTVVLKADALSVAPLVLLGVLAAGLLLGCLKLVVGGALAFINPLLGLFYAFFFQKNIGKQLLKAVLTTLLVTALVCVLNYLSFTGIAIAAVSVLTYLPIILVGLLLWYVIEQFL